MTEEFTVTDTFEGICNATLSRLADRCVAANFQNPIRIVAVDAEGGLMFCQVDYSTDPPLMPTMGTIAEKFPTRFISTDFDSSQQITMVMTKEGTRIV
ncbi:hypothetical protein [Rhizobium sp. PL01]|uniref:hypothetical protein n=1 Tax=Rhizobium sp. PL01 TaxID=3085631 RepID=UPI002980EC37|nr:hypothetical protein [Rhizobium sp. PL01]MDW5315497.1 hypothetical protein [Rhizobium sp. PL01]